MSEQEKNNTEQRIFETASRIFQRHGYGGGARMQEIADESDINISMLHYYYRSKEQFFEKVYEQFMEERKAFLVEFILNGINYKKMMREHLYP